MGKKKSKQHSCSQSPLFLFWSHDMVSKMSIPCDPGGVPGLTVYMMEMSNVFFGLKIDTLGICEGSSDLSHFFRSYSLSDRINQY